MPRNYNSYGVVTAGANKTAVTLISAATIRPKIYELLIGCAATPAAQAALWALQRLTAEGTGTAFTPVAEDNADPASLASSATNHSVEPTYTANAYLFIQALNQQASWSERFTPGAEPTLPASTNGAGLRTISSTGTAVHNCSLMWSE